MDFLAEAFKSLDSLEENVFPINDIDNLNDFTTEDADETSEEVVVIDGESDGEEEVEGKDYTGKAILQCVVCRSLSYEDKENIVVDDNGDTVNSGHECPYCYSTDGFEIIGEVAPYTETQVTATDEDGNEVDVEVEKTTVDSDDIEDEDVEETLSIERFNRKTESLDSVKLDNGEESYEIKVKPSSQEPSDDSMIVPPSEEFEMSIDNDELDSEEGMEDEMLTDEEDWEEPDEGFEVEEETEETEDTNEENESLKRMVRKNKMTNENNEDRSYEDEFVDVDVDEADEDAIDEVCEKYLRRVYENVKSYKTKNIYANDRRLVVEGLISFKSGNTKKTRFDFTPSVITKRGKAKFIGENKDISKGKKTFTMVGNIRCGKFMAESLNYNYRAKDEITGVSKRVYGTEQRKNRVK